MDLSIVIPARNEMFLKQTIEDILKNIEGDTEIIAVLDGYWPDPQIVDHPRVTLIHHTESIGQRAAQNEAVKISKAKYVMKVDAHCAFDKGFDVKMMADMNDNWTMTPLMRNLHAFDWVCDEGHKRYQGPEGPCETCGKPTSREIVWIGKTNPQSTAYRFDKNLRFQYWGEYKKRQVGDIVDTLSLQGSCFMCTRDNYWRRDLCDESWGSWGQQGSEVAIKTWLSGGEVKVNKKTWYAHMFRTQPGFTWPYPPPGRSQHNARKICQDIFLNDKWPKAKRSLKWLLDKFAPVPGWEEPTKGIIYYTDNQLDPKIMAACQKQLMLLESSKLPIISVSLKPIEFGVNYVMPLERSHLTMTKQILKGLEESSADVIFFCEHDVLYHPSHFDFTPPKKDVYYYNENSWLLRAKDGHCLYYDHKSQSGLCAYRETLLKHYQKKVARLQELWEESEQNTKPVKAASGNDIPYREAVHRVGFEPGANTRPFRIDDLPAEGWRSPFPNVDIKHDNNLTWNRWKIDQFRDKTPAKTWKEADEIPGWGKGKEILNGK